MKYEIELNHKDYLLLLDVLSDACKSATGLKLLRLCHLYDEVLETAPENPNAAGPAHLQEE